MNNSTAIEKENPLAVIIANSIETWATASSINIGKKRRDDVKRDKKNAVDSFFSLVGKLPDRVDSKDVLTWNKWLIDDRKAESTIYTRLSHLSSYFNWLMKDPRFQEFIKFNPVRLVMPKPPKKYNSPKAKALTDAELQVLFEFMEKAAENPENLVAVRDYAIFRLFMATGMRREEILDLSGADIKFDNDKLLIHAKIKGGVYDWRSLEDAETIAALERYLTLARRKSTVGQADRALWIRFDRAAKVAAFIKKTEDPLGDEPRFSSHSFDKQMKSYAAHAGIGQFNIHRFRHTFARIVAEESGSIRETQDALGHRDEETTRVYVQRIGIKKDRFSGAVSRRLKRKSSETEATELGVFRPNPRKVSISI